MAEKKQAGSGAVGARRLAREKMAAALEARRSREEQNTRDLETFYVVATKLDSAAAKRDAAIAAAHASHAEAEAAALDEQGAALRSIRDRNTPQAELLEMTGLSVGELQRLLKRSAPAVKPASAGKAARVGKSTDSGGADSSNVTPIGSRGTESAQPDRADSAPAAEDREALGASSPGSVS